MEQGGAFIRAWEARYGPLSRRDLIVMRDANLGMFAAWCELEGKTSWSVDQFIGSFSSWGRPSDLYWEYLLAYRMTVRGTQAAGGVIAAWRDQVGVIADYYPPAKWADEWARGVMSRKFNVGTRGGRSATPGEVILGKDALALAEQQVRRDEFPE
jgi:hypothetical protein